MHDAPPLVVAPYVIAAYAITTDAEVPRLAIGSSIQSTDVMLLFCDAQWNVLRVSAHQSMADAQQRGTELYPGVAWIEQPVSEEQALAFLESLADRVTCSFCGRSEDEVERMVARGDVRICDICLRNFSAQR